MPSLGFLKKRRTKGSRDLGSPRSPTADSIPPVPSPTTKAARGSVTPASAQSSHHRSLPPQAATQVQPAESMSSAEQSQPHTPHDVSQPPQYPSSSPQDGTAMSDQNAPNVAHMIDSPQVSDPPQGHPALAQVQVDGPADASRSTASQNANAQTNFGGMKPTPRVTKGKYQLTDFAIQRTLGTGSFGRVHLVQSRHNQRFYAVKVLKKNQVVKMKQVEHTNDERRMLGMVKHPFLITLWGTFQDSKNLYMVMDFVEGGELFSLLRKSQVRQVIAARVT